MGSLPPSQELRSRDLRGCIHRPEKLSDKRSDNLYENERKSPLSILKPPPKQPKAFTIQARVEESVKSQLELYAEFIDTSPSYVITEALKLLFRKDEDFRRWTDQHGNNPNNEKARGEVLQRPFDELEVPSNSIRYAREHSVLKTACLAPCSRILALEVRRGYPEKFATSTANSSLDIPCKRVGHVNHYHATGGGHRNRNGR